MDVSQPATNLTSETVVIPENTPPMAITVPTPATTADFLQQYLDTSRRPSIAVSAIKVYEPGRTSSADLLDAARKAVRRYGPASNVEGMSSPWFGIDWQQIAANRSIHQLFFAHWFSLVQLVMKQLSAVAVPSRSIKQESPLLAGLRFLKGVVLPLYNSIASQGSAMLDSPGSQSAMVPYFTQDAELLINSGLVFDATASSQIAYARSMYTSLRSGLTDLLTLVTSKYDISYGIVLPVWQLGIDPTQEPDLLNHMTQVFTTITAAFDQIQAIARNQSEAALLAMIAGDVPLNTISQDVLALIQRHGEALRMTVGSSDVVMTPVEQGTSLAELESVKTENDRLKKELETAQKKLSDQPDIEVLIESAVADARKERDEKNKLLQDEKDAENARLRDDLKASRAQAGTALDNVKLLEQSTASLKESADKMTTEMQTLQGELATERGRTAGEKDRLKAAVDAAVARANEESDERNLRNLAASNAQIEGLHTQLKAAMDQEKRSMDLDIKNREKIRAGEQRITEQQQLIAEQQQQIRELSDENARLQDLVNNFSSVRERDTKNREENLQSLETTHAETVRSLTTQKDALTSEVQTLKDEVQQVQRELKTATDALAVQQTTAFTDVAALTAELANLQIQHGRDMQSERERLEAEKKALEDIILRDQKTTAQLRSDADQASKAKDSEIRGLTDQVSQAGANLEQLRQNMEQKENTHIKELDDKKAALDTANQKVKTLSAELEKATNERKELLQQNTALAEQSRIASESNTKLTEDVRLAELKIASLEEANKNVVVTGTNQEHVDLERSLAEERQKLEEATKATSAIEARLVDSNKNTAVITQQFLEQLLDNMLTPAVIINNLTTRMGEAIDEGHE